jgi:uncharacterized protein YkwD
MAAVLLAGCAGEPRRAGPISARTAERLAAARVDPAAATRILNAYRAGRGLGPVRLDPALTAMAQRQADAMVARNEMSHDAGGSFSARVASGDLDTARAAENIAAGQLSTQEVLETWRNSTSHDANLRMPEATRFGIALAKDAGTSYGAYWALVIAAEPERRTTPQIGGPVPAGFFGSNRVSIY